MVLLTGLYHVTTRYAPCFQSFTNGAGFYIAAGKEVVSDQRKIVVKDRETGEYIDNFSNAKDKGTYSYEHINDRCAHSHEHTKDKGIASVACSDLL